MADALGEVTSLSSLISYEHQLLWFDSVILMLQARLPLLLAALALIRDTFGEMSITNCYAPDFTGIENKAFVNAYCKYRENLGILGYHEFIPFTFTLQTVLIQIPVLAWISFGGRKMSMVAVGFARYCKKISDYEAAKINTADADANAPLAETDRPNFNAIVKDYVDEFSISRTYFTAYFVFKILLCIVTVLSLYYHCHMVKVTIEPNFFNHKFECYVETLNVTVICVKPYEIFNQILIIINIVICLAIPLILMFLREPYLLFKIYNEKQKQIWDFVPYLKKEEDKSTFNNTNILLMYYVENMGLEEKYVQKLVTKKNEAEAEAEAKVKAEAEAKVEANAKIRNKIEPGENENVV